MTIEWTYLGWMGLWSILDRHELRGRHYGESHYKLT